MPAHSLCMPAMIMIIVICISFPVINYHAGDDPRGSGDVLSTIIPGRLPNIPNLLIQRLVMRPTVPFAARLNLLEYLLELVTVNVSSSFHSLRKPADSLLGGLEWHCSILQEQLLPPARYVYVFSS